MAWEFIPLQDVVETFIDYRGKTPIKTESGIPLITAKIIKNGTILKPTEYISPDDYDTWMRRGIPQYGDIVITTEAPLGEVAQLRFMDRFALAQRVITLRGKKDVLDNTFLKYALWFDPVQGELSGRASGTTVQGIKSSELRKVKIPVPAYPVQRKIADILGTLDDKIENNRRMNETLEQMAMELYKHLFVDELLNETATVRFGDYVQINPAIQVKRGTNIKFVEMKALPTDLMSVLDDDVIEKPFTSGSKFQKGDTLFARITPCLENGKTAFVDFLNKEEPAFGSTEFLVFRAKGMCNPYFVYCLSRSEPFRNFAIKSMVGTSGRQRVQTSSIEEYIIPQPDDNLMLEFEGKVKAWFDKIRNNTKEIGTIKQLRDYLMPRLLSGEIEVKVAEKQIEEALLSV